MKRLRLVGKLLAILIKDRIHHPTQLAVDSLLIVARCGVVLLLYRYVFALRGGAIAGIGYAAAAWSMFLYFAFSALRLREVAFLIMRDVQSGNAEVLLGKPISYVPYRCWWQLGAGLYPSFVITAAGGLALLASVGIPQAMRSAAFLPGVIAVVLGGILLSLLLYALVGLLAFWIEDIAPLYWIVDKSVVILGGAYLPVAMFPSALRRIAIYSPFGATQFLTHSLADGWTAEWPRLLAIQLAWCALLGAGVAALFARAQRKVTINGG